MGSAGNATPALDDVGWDMGYRMRATFYALEPEETYVQHIKDLPDLQVKVFPFMFLFTVMELLVLRWRGKGTNFRLHTTAINYCTGQLKEAGRNFMFRGVELSAYIWIYNHWRLVALPWDSPLTYVLAMLGVDLCTYWWHRMCHEVSFMWAAHYVHHSSEDFNSSLGSRISMTMRPWKWVYYLPLAFVGLPPTTFIVHQQLNFIWGFWVHNSVFPKVNKIVPVLGHIIEFIVVTPSHHRVHHGSNQYCIDKNYGSYLIIWDRLFGTFVEERDDEEIVYGTLSHTENNHVIGIQLAPWKDLWDRFAAAKTPGDRLRTLVYGPGWSSGQPRLGNIEDIPDVRGRKKFQFVSPRWYSLYLALHSFVLFSGYIEMSSRIKNVSSSMALLHLCYNIMACAAIGGLYSGHKGSMWLEPWRLVLSLPLCLVLPVFDSQRLITFVSCVNCVSLLLWPLVRSQGLAMAEKKVK